MAPAAPFMAPIPTAVAGPPVFMHHYPSTNSSASSSQSLRSFSPSSGISTQLDDTTSKSSSIPLSVEAKARRTLAYWLRPERIGWGTIIQNAQYRVRGTLVGDPFDLPHLIIYNIIDRERQAYFVKHPAGPEHGQCLPRHIFT
jgi:hypothetical protein